MGSDLQISVFNGLIAENFVRGVSQRATSASRKPGFLDRRSSLPQNRKRPRQKIRERASGSESPGELDRQRGRNEQSSDAEHDEHHLAPLHLLLTADAP